MPLDRQFGLAWDGSRWSPEARWAREPELDDIECVCRRVLQVQPLRPCTVTFHEDTTFTKLYLIACEDRSFLMGVTLPVSPRHKTLGEVATLQWVREHTNIPVPEVIAFDNSNHNAIGFEWILMNFVPGVPAYRKWRTMSWEQKVAFTKRMAKFQVQLFRNGASDYPFKKIGTLVQGYRSGGADLPTRATPGKLITPDFFTYDRLKYGGVPRGPFRSSQEWLTSQIDLVQLEQNDVLKTSKDEDERKDAKKLLDTTQRLLSFLPYVFRESSKEEVSTALHHDDLRLQNILVDEHGEITAIMGWECVSAMPIRFTTKMPEFLVGERSREEEPDRDAYSDETPEEAAENRENGVPDDLDNEGKNGLYWIHLMDYETTQLRKVYEVKLREFWPGWPLEESRFEVDFCEAVLQCSCGVSVKPVNRWLDSLEKKDAISLEAASLPQWEVLAYWNPETEAIEPRRRPYQSPDTVPFEPYQHTLQH